MIQLIPEETVIIQLMMLRKLPDLTKSSIIRALCSVFAKKNTTLEAEMLDVLSHMYRKNLKPEVRDFIEEMEE